MLVVIQYPLRRIFEAAESQNEPVADAISRRIAGSDRLPDPLATDYQEFLTRELARRSESWAQRYRLSGTVALTDKHRPHQATRQAAPPEWDLACAAWSYIPLYDDEYCRRYGYSTAPRGPRLRLFCDAYGLTERAGFIDLIRARELALYDMVRLSAAAGDPRYLPVWQQSQGQRWLDAVAYLDRERDTWTRYLE